MLSSRASGLGRGAPASGLTTVRSRHRDGGELRRRVGEFVGNIFYGTLLRQMQASRLKKGRFYGGRGEEVFQGQLGMELAKRLGRTVNDPLANRLYESIHRHLGKTVGRKAMAETSVDEPVPQGAVGDMRGFPETVEDRARASSFAGKTGGDP